MNVAINGFGRIGRNFFRAALQNSSSSVNVTAVNDLADVKTLAHLLKYDSVYGKLGNVSVSENNNLLVNGKEIKVLGERDPANLPWADNNIDIVIESTGIFRTREDASKHIQAGAKKVIVTAPCDNVDAMIVLGVNDAALRPDDKIISMIRLYQWLHALQIALLQW
jgi:glyceraldehyde 3-phosphate dehydrogenase